MSAIERHPVANQGHGQHETVGLPLSVQQVPCRRILSQPSRASGARGSTTVLHLALSADRRGHATEASPGQASDAGVCGAPHTPSSLSEVMNGRAEEAKRWLRIALEGGTRSPGPSTAWRTTACWPCSRCTASLRGSSGGHTRTGTAIDCSVFHKSPHQHTRGFRTSNSPTHLLTHVNSSSPLHTH